jgi:hypothetical protein
MSRVFYFGCSWPPHDFFTRKKQTMSDKITIMVGGRPEEVPMTDIEKNECRDRTGKSLICWDTVRFSGMSFDHIDVIQDIAFDNGRVLLHNHKGLVDPKRLHLLRRGVMP